MEKKEIEKKKKKKRKDISIQVVIIKGPRRAPPFAFVENRFCCFVLFLFLFLLIPSSSCSFCSSFVYYHHSFVCEKMARLVGAGGLDVAGLLALVADALAVGFSGAVARDVADFAAWTYN